MEIDPENILAAKDDVLGDEVDDDDDKMASFKLKSKLNATSRVAMEEKVDYLKLMRHIELNHPTYELPDV